MSQNKKHWSGKDIRKLARELMEQEDQGMKESDRDSSAVKAPAKAMDEEALEFFWGRFEKSKAERAAVVASSLHSDYGTELKRLASTLGLETVKTDLLSAHHKVRPDLYIGSGRAEQLLEEYKELKVDVLIFDLKLSPTQIRNLENFFQLPVIDRHALILSIFNRHAQSKWAKMQVELAQLQYLATRLTGIWEGFSRQRGAAGGLGGRGLGEKRLELDRRVLKERIAALKKKLEKAETSYHVQANKRSRLPRVALVGYTNAGKSTLMNALTQAKTLEENKLFSTLDTLVRPLMPLTEPRVLVSDTIGFIRDLPPDLVASFKSTLQEAVESRLLLHVLDLSSEDWERQFESTEEILTALGADKIPRFFVFNKVDLFKGKESIEKLRINKMTQERFEGSQSFFISAKEEKGLDELKSAIIEFCKVEIPLWSRSYE